eukprot:5113370-Prymnesium_polylepis.1
MARLTSCVAASGPPGPKITSMSAKRGDSCASALWRCSPVVAAACFFRMKKVLSACSRATRSSRFRRSAASSPCRRSACFCV